VSEGGLTRRGLVGAGAAAGAGAVLASGAPARAAKRRHVDVVVVGAGFAGLTAAWQLKKEGASVVVLEARDRVGGRALNRKIGGGEVSERGATFAGPTQDHILDLAEKLGVDTFPTFVDGDNVYVDSNGTRSTYSDTLPTGTAPPDPVIAADLAQVVTRLNEMSKEVPVDAPWEADEAPEWDGQTLETWIKDNSVTPQFQQLVPVATRPIFGAEPRELSLLFVLFYIAASGNEDNVGTFERNFNTRNGAQEQRFEGGAQLIALRLADKLKDRIELEAPVKRIEQSGGGVDVFAQGIDVRAERAIVAIPPTLAGRIQYDPLLPSSRDQLTQRLGQGNLIKVTAVYDTPFWRDDGLNGQTVSYEGPVNVTFDDSPEDGSKGVIFGFVGGDEARRFKERSNDDRRDAVLDNFVKYFGGEASDPEEYFETDWAAEEWTRGCPVGILGAGTLLGLGPAIREPVHRIHWAGTETSTFWNGYMDGAVRSGKRAAEEVLDEL
jgi:monoamine oxidase